MTDDVRDETTGTVVLALGANVGVAAAKIVGGLVSGSAALLSEGAHSVTDVLNEVFLLLSLHRSERPADRTHPFGYGMERFFWSLLAAVGILVAGAGFAVYEGVGAVRGSDAETSTAQFVVVYVVLGVSLVFEAVSLTKAVRQVHGEAERAGRQLVTYVLRSPDPTVKTVASEDSAAVVGIGIAVVGTALHQATGAEVWEGVASFVIAGLLAYVALALGRDTKELLIGEAADPAVRLVALHVIAAHHEVERVAEILTMQLGPTSVLVAARIQFVEDVRAREIESVCTDIEQEMLRRVPSLQQVFLDPSTVTDDQVAAGRNLLAENVEDVRRLDGADAEILQRLEDVRTTRTRAARRIAVR
ncbi:MAG: cation diffusion facilitator family transporter [Mycobacteriales bacterium]